MKLLQENSKALLYQVADQHFEVWIKLIRSVGKDKGTTIEPSDEDFGVSAWCFTSKTRAEKCFQEITDGKRVITPMLESETA